LVELTATSVAEILAGLLEQFEAALLDEDIATALLTGIMGDERATAYPGKSGETVVGQLVKTALHAQLEPQSVDTSLI